MVKAKKTSVFWKIYIAVAVVCCVAIGGWLVWLYGWLGDYEASQPKYVAETAYEKYFKTFDAREYVNFCGVNENSFESEEDVVDYLESVTDGKEITYKKVASGLEGTIKYIIIAGEGDNEVKFASFVLTEKVSGKFKKYEAGDYQIYADSKNIVKIEAPKGYKVLVNGKDVGEKYIVENDIETDSCNHMPEGVSGTYYTKYSLRTLKADPDIQILTADGTEAAIEKKDNYYKALPVYDQALCDEYSEWILEGAELYARYTQYDENVNVVTFKKVAPYFDPESALYESIRTMDNMFVQYYDSYEFTDKTATEFVKYDENTFSCRVQLTQLMFSKNEVYDDYIDQTLYLRRVGDQFLIYDMQVNVD